MEEHTHDDESNVVTPIHSHQMNLDDLENVEGFNGNGKKNKLYGFKLNTRGIYERSKIPIYDLKIFDEGKIYKNTPLNFIYHHGKWKLFRDKHDWDIDMKVKNKTVSCKGDSLYVLRIFNSGSMIGNFIPIDKMTVLTKFHGEYCIGAEKDKGLTVI